MSCRISRSRYRPRSGLVRSRLTASDGFTLLEVLIAIALVAVVLGAIGELVGTTAKGIRSVDRKLPLLETAQNLLATLPERAALKPGSQSGEAGGLQWRIDVVPIAASPPAIAPATTALDAAQSPPPAPKWQPYEIIVRVQGGDGPPVRLDTVRLVPIPGAQSRPAG
jgi:general secretion pathway protein I